MKPVRRRDAMEPLQKFKDEFENMFDRFFKEPFLSDKSILSKDSFTPACNIKEEKDAYMIEVDLPGVEPEDIDIEIDNNYISIKGERKSKVETEDEEKQMHVVESSYGSYHRAFTLPDNVKSDAITADYKNGVLSISIPKTEDGQARRIPITKQD